jgi:3-oxoacyl-[acyl-carrier protein] reductase
MTDLLSNKTALVTGGSRGIGRAICNKLASLGARVAVNYHNNEQRANEVVEEITQAAGAAVAIQADVSVESDVQRLVRETEAQLGPVDLLVNNAGIFDPVDHNATTTEIWKRTMAVNLDGPFYTTWAVKDGMIERGFGRIVNITSIAGLRPRPRCIAYATSKAGLIGFTRSVAEALAPHNIRVNAVAPGLIDTEIIADVDEAKKQALIDATPISRLGQPDEIAEVVAFLLTEQSSFVTGQTYVADGGRVTLP